MGLDLLGWTVEREAQQAAGRTDIALTWPGNRDRALVEVKIWGRNDFRDVQDQVESYWTEQVVAGAVVMLTDREIDEWSDRYQRDCLQDSSYEIEGRALEISPILHAFRCTSRTPDNMTATVEHFLLRLPRGK